MDFFIQPYDFLMLAVLVLSVAFGAWKGMAWQLAALASLVVSTLVALRFGRTLAPFLDVKEPWNYCAAVLILYVAVSLVIWAIFRMVAEFIDRVRLREFDRQIGATFGLVKGVLWCMLITFFAVTLSDAMRSQVLRSRSGYYAALLVHRATPLLPTKVRDVLGRYIEEFDRQLDPGQLAEPRPAEPDAAELPPLEREARRYAP
jgi:membrane protein required for colicin V production